ncbi:MAG: TOBE domain-containing protein [Nitrospirales bacterium]|nr:TOBE domain-containing protein [Nitrospirales bacterium]
MKLSSRNQIKGKVVDIVKEQIMAKVKVDIGGGTILTSIITADAANDLGLKAGDEVTALIKATSIMIAK